MKPSDFQKTVQCRFESCFKKVVRSVVKDYYKVSAKYCYVTHELRLHQNDRCKRFTLFQF